MSQRHAELLGRALAGTYVVERLLGTGGMGAVYAARHARTGGLVAVKVLDAESAKEEETYRRFQSEARIVSALRHPNIVQVIDFDEDDDGTPFLVMELLEGQDLHQRLRRVERLPLGAVIELARQVGGALHAAHQLGVVHRDVKPQNVFLSRHQLTDEVLEVAKVVDFGISKIRDHASVTQDRTVLGTPYYMSPEAAQALNDELDGRSDQWGLAVILYRSLSGKLPYSNPDPLAVLYQVVNERHTPIAQLVPETPRHVAQAIERAMSKRKEDRFPTMADFVRAIERAPASTESASEARPADARGGATGAPVPGAPGRVPDAGASGGAQGAAASAEEGGEGDAYDAIEVVSQERRSDAQAVVLAAHSPRPQRRLWLGLIILVACLIGGVAGHWVRGRLPWPKIAAPTAATPVVGVSGVGVTGEALAPTVTPTTGTDGAAGAAGPAGGVTPLQDAGSSPDLPALIDARPPGALHPMGEPPGGPKGPPRHKKQSEIDKDI